jgi:GGDEF domain-containing protein
VDDPSAQQPEVPRQGRDIAADVLRSFALERRGAVTDGDSAMADRVPAEEQASPAHDRTRVYSRSAGFVELDRDIARAKRTGHPLTLVSVEVDDLAAGGASRGLPAATMVADAAHAITAHMRPYDLIIRSGEGAFVCAMSDFSPAAARERLVRVNAAFADSTGRRSLATGAVELRQTDSRDDVLARALAAVSDGRQEQRPAP